MRDTIDMAREAGLHIPYWGEEEDPKKDPPRWTMVAPLPPLLKAFEALVRADAIADEREACARIAEEPSVATYECTVACGGPAQTFQQRFPKHSHDIAKEIRARGTSD